MCVSIGQGNTVLLSTAYLPPVQYISKFLLAGRVLIEAHENFQKQSYRNRCCICGANGKQCLVIPVLKHHNEKMPISEVEIDYGKPWQQVHLKSIRSAYSTSPFYEFYADEFNALFHRKVRLLADWNRELLEYVLRILHIETDVNITDRYEKEPEGIVDLRQAVHPKARLQKPDGWFTPVPYAQVFGERHGFIPGLSIIDLLFNEGPQARSILKMCL